MLYLWKPPSPGSPGSPGGPSKFLPAHSAAQPSWAAAAPAAAASPGGGRAEGHDVGSVWRLVLVGCSGKIPRNTGNNTSIMGIYRNIVRIFFSQIVGLREAYVNLWNTFVERPRIQSFK